MEKNIDQICEISKDAGHAILEIYNDPASSTVVDYKADHSPLTLADKASHNVIVDALPSLFPDIPILSEEGKEVEYQTRKNWSKYWLIDPLDGTKEFINRNGEFTVNIALIENGKTTLGVIYVPVNNTLYFGSKKGAFKSFEDDMIQIHVNNKPSDRIAVRSKSHASPEEDVLYSEYGINNFISVGSSLKFCMVAEGKADLYYRHGPTMEWDTAAGQAVLEAAGGRVFIGNTADHQFVYNKRDLLNSSFLCLGF